MFELLHYCSDGMTILAVMVILILLLYRNVFQDRTQTLRGF